MGYFILFLFSSSFVARLVDVDILFSSLSLSFFSLFYSFTFYPILLSLSLCAFSGVELRFFFLFISDTSLCFVDF